VLCIAFAAKPERKISTLDLVGAGSIVATTALLEKEAELPSSVVNETVATFWMVLPAGLATCAEAPAHTLSNAKAAETWRKNLQAADRHSKNEESRTFVPPIDAPRAGRLFTVPPASCVGAPNGGLCISSRPHELAHSGD
jgi:hypothetical protein